MNSNISVVPDVDKDWWRGAVIYQIYPRSYQDANGDGIGDLKGITQRLPYIAGLGVDAVWISPFFKSPMKDFGYDVSDYKDVDPIFGNLHDFDELIKTAHHLGLKIMIDLVLSHTADQHEWFKESRSSRDNEYHDWYVWADAKPDGTAPNNWLSIFGGPAWTWDTTRCQYYMHNFLTSQPDLNFHNPKVQDALLDVADFWLARGVDGFRLDTINFYFCDKLLRDNPALPDSQRNSSIAPSVNPYNFQNHLYDKNQPENIEFLERLRGVMDEYPAAAAVGEVGDAQYGMQILADYTAGDKRVQMCYSFEFLSGDAPDAPRIEAVLRSFMTEAPESWSCWAFSNHDVVRHATRWAEHHPQQHDYLCLMTTLILCLRGSVCLYQGEELGLPEADVAFEDLQDPYGITFWPKFKGRDGCRTPMPWEHEALNAGFSGHQPWLPLAEPHRFLSVDTQQEAEHSMLHFYQSALAMRRRHSVLAKGALSELKATDQLLQFVRHDDNESLLCAFNISDQAVTVELPVGAENIAEHGLFNSTLSDQSLALPAWSASIVRIPHLHLSTNTDAKEL
ncbi:alpha-amylase family glycosyl hydrolase [Leucothrix mucor]|uniref:alpha-amylase family glycosyl hydrolase n=1 Tax=Leucothrix mucor TaxID=45248 RepID=UPI0003B756BC|nr:alpha-amylase family glycosyl hydrolase [Leucothrix mucor]